MRIDTAFLKQVSATLGIAALLGTYPLLRCSSHQVVIAILAGTVLSTVNVVLGFLAIEYAIDKSYTTFLKAVLGGMGIRMALMLGALFVLIKFFSFHTVALLLSMLGFYVIFLILEVSFIQKRVITRDTH